MGPVPQVVIVDDDPVTRRVIASVLKDAEMEPVVCATAAEAYEALEARQADVVCLDVLLPDASGEHVLLELRSRHPDLPVIMLSAQDSVERAVDIMKLRPFDYFVKPFSHERLLHSVHAALRERGLKRRVQELEREVQDAFRFEDIIGRSPRMRLVYGQIEKVLDNRVSVFIHGESGTGKELVAKAIHYNGPRRGGPFVALNCGSIAESLQESELFGHEKGSFTGAFAQHRGKFEQAHRGTLFLDEVGELSPAVQTRLLRVLQEGTLQRVGAAQTISVDVRIVSATHRDLEALVAEGRFRQDLYYRLVVYPIELPALRDRVADVPLLVDHLSRKHAKMLGRGAVSFEQDAVDVLCRYDYPGNVRELENIVVRTLVSGTGSRVQVSDLPPGVVRRAMGLPEVAGAAAPNTGSGQVVPLDQVERQAITHAIGAFDGNMSLAAKALGIGRATLYRKLAAYGLAK